MMWVIVLFTLLFLLIISLLFVPIELYVDTITNEYYFRLRGLIKADIEGHEKELIRIRLNLIFGNFYFYPLRRIGLSQKGKTKKNVRKKKGKRMGIGKVIRLLKTFTIKRLIIDMDTGDSLLNAKLYPVFTFLNHTMGRFSINFQGRNHLVLYIQNRPLNIIKSFVNL
ncbi:hypothetical protein [Ulvibacterium marinum]|uniref:hypothetical protein n=1 Tax=Ulvibacterium marinum TaxID=2419782 RepID=UPI00249512E9|nr:hypothetical protein [Ulvibacterium marinum]